MSEEETSLERVMSGKTWEEFCDTLKVASCLAHNVHQILKRWRSLSPVPVRCGQWRSLWATA